MGSGLPGGDGMPVSTMCVLPCHSGFGPVITDALASILAGVIFGNGILGAETFGAAGFGAAGLIALAAGASCREARLTPFSLSRRRSSHDGIILQDVRRNRTRQIGDCYGAVMQTLGPLPRVCQIDLLFFRCLQEAVGELLLREEVRVVGSHVSSRRGHRSGWFRRSGPHGLEDSLQGLG